MFRIILIAFFFPILAFGKKMDTISPLNLLAHPKLELTFAYDGEIFQLNSSSEALKINVTRIYLARNQHLKLIEQEKIQSCDTIIENDRVYFKEVKPYDYTNQDGIVISALAYQLRTVYDGMIYTFEFLDINSIKEFNRCTNLVIKYIEFYGEAYSETPQFANFSEVQYYMDNLTYADSIQPRIMKQNELFKLLLKGVENEVDREEALKNLSTDVYNDYLRGTLDEYTIFLRGLNQNEKSVKKLISCESILINDGFVDSDDFPAINYTTDIAIEIAFTLEQDDNKYNVGLVLLGVNNSKLLNFMFEKY